MQTELGLCVNVPLLQVKLEVPVLGADESVMVADVPPLGTSAGKMPLQVLPPTDQDTEVPAKQPEVHVAPATGDKTPAEQVNRAEPTAGATLSVIVPVVEPLAITEVVEALHVRVPTRHVTLWGLQLLPLEVQLAPGCSIKMPLSHMNRATPVVGAKVSDVLTDWLLAVLFKTDVQVAEPTCQDTEDAPQSPGAGLNPAPEIDLAGSVGPTKWSKDRSTLGPT